MTFKNYKMEKGEERELRKIEKYLFSFQSTEDHLGRE